MDLGNVLKGIKPRFKNFHKCDRSEIPLREPCVVCRALVNWYWLDSDCEEEFPSMWLKHLCICEVIATVSKNLNMSMVQTEMLRRGIEDNSITKRHSKRKMELLYDVIEDIDRYIAEKKDLLKKLQHIKVSYGDPNTEYLKHRIELADNYEAWWELFDCCNADEGRKLLANMYQDGSDKFLEELEVIQKEFFGEKEVNS